MEVKGLFWKDETIGKINEVQLGLISTSTSNVVIETNLVSPVDTKQVRKAVRYRTASVHTRAERYDIVSFQFLVHFPCRPISGPVLERTAWFFAYPCEHNPSPYHFLERTEVERYDIVPVWTGSQLSSYTLTREHQLYVRALLNRSLRAHSAQNELF